MTGTTDNALPVPPQPNKMAMSAHLHMLFAPLFVQPYPDAWIEIAHGLPDRGPAQARRFSAFDLAGAVSFAEGINKEGHNVYVGAALRQGVRQQVNTVGGGRGTDANYLDASHAWADVDHDVPKAWAALRLANLPPAIVVTTGTVPETRAQFYFRLKPECPVSPTLLIGANKALQELLSGDAVSNPGRVMRLAGTVNWPSTGKAARGYVPEVTAFDLDRMPARGTDPITYPVERLAMIACLAIESDGKTPSPAARGGNGAAPPGADPWVRFADMAGTGRAGRDDAALYDLLRASQTKGCWHNSMRDAIATMVGRGWEEASIRFACAPYCQDGASDPDLKPLIDGAFRKWGHGEPQGLGIPAAGPDQLVPRILRFPSGWPNAEEVSRAREERTREEAREEARDAPKATPKPPITPYELHWHDATAEAPVQPWLVKDLLPETGLGLLAGQWGTGKSLVALDLAGSVATGLPFAGHDVVRRGGVLYIAAEGGSTMVSRLKALVEHKLLAAAQLGGEPGHGSGLDPLVNLDKLPIAWITASPNVQDPREFGKLHTTVQAAEKQMQEAYGVPLALIVIDTMARVGGYKDANDAAEAQRVMNRLATLGDSTAAFVAVLDHFGKDVSTGTRNSSAKEDFADIVLAFVADRELTGALSNTVMGVRKSRVGSAGAEISYDLTLVELDSGETSRVVTWKERRTSEPVSSGCGKTKWSKSQRLFRTAFDNALISSGHMMRPYGAEGPQVRAVTYEAIRQDFVKIYPAPTPRAKNERFRQALHLARSNNQVASQEVGGVDYLWLVDDPTAPAPGTHPGFKGGAGQTPAAEPYHASMGGGAGGPGGHEP